MSEFLDEVMQDLAKVNEDDFEEPEEEVEYDVDIVVGVIDDDELKKMHALRLIYAKQQRPIIEDKFEPLIKKFSEEYESPQDMSAEDTKALDVLREQMNKLSCKFDFIEMLFWTSLRWKFPELILMGNMTVAIRKGWKVVYFKKKPSKTALVGITIAKLP